MAYLSLVDTSLDLNANPLSLVDEVPVSVKINLTNSVFFFSRFSFDLKTHKTWLVDLFSNFFFLVLKKTHFSE